MRLGSTFAFLLLFLGFAPALRAQQQEWVIESLTPEGAAVYDLSTGVASGTNGVIVKYGNAILVADRVAVNQRTGEAIAEGRVRIQSDDMIWAGENIIYNFKTRRIVTQEFRVGKPPYFAGGKDLSGETGTNGPSMTSGYYTATNGFITVDDYAQPAMRVRAKRLVIRPGQSMEAHGATMEVGGVPVFYLPYYSQSLDRTSPAFMVTPGYRSKYGAFILASYNWNWGDYVDATLHVDYRTARGPGIGPDFDFHLGNWGEAKFKYYYIHDSSPETNSLGTPYPEDRQRVEFSWLASPFTNSTYKARASYETDAGMRLEYFEHEARNNPQPSTFVEARHFSDNFSMSVIASPRLNNFYETVERLPEIKFSAFRQQIGATPLYYESESRAGYLNKLFAETNSFPTFDYSATRADTFHQVVLPLTAFGWLNFTPRVGGRLTYYSTANGPGATTQEETRGVFNTGAELTCKASQTWVGMHGGIFDLDGLRHVIQPAVNYVYVPRPTALPPELPQFDYELPSLALLPIDFPDYNAIDSIDSRNVIRFGLRNYLQTKRDGHISPVVDWDVFTDWRIQPDPGQSTFDDLCSSLKVQPRSWISFESSTRYDVEQNHLRMSFDSLTLTPNSRWSWRPGYLYLRDDFSADPTAWGPGGETLTSTFYYRLNENWGLRMSHYYDVREGTLREQAYTVYRDFRVWTGAFVVRFRQPSPGVKEEFAFAFNLSLKALPTSKPGKDTVTGDPLFSY
jgi:lipopolysaccharide assembly outer membrane protein LptD (OstA)